LKSAISVVNMFLDEQVRRKEAIAKSSS